MITPKKNYQHQLAFTKLEDILVSPNVQGLGTVNYSAALWVSKLEP